MWILISFKLQLLNRLLISLYNTMWTRLGPAEPWSSHSWSEEKKKNQGGPSYQSGAEYPPWHFNLIKSN